MTSAKLKELAAEASPETRETILKLLGVVKTEEKAKASIRMPKEKVPNKGEAEFGRLLQAAFPASEVRYEAICFRLPSGTRYTPDWTVFRPEGMLAVEIKGAYRLGSAGASARAFKEACSSYREIEFWHATKDENGKWNTVKANETNTSNT